MRCIWHRGGEGGSRGRSCEVHGRYEVRASRRFVCRSITLEALDREEGALGGLQASTLDNLPSGTWERCTSDESPERAPI